MVTQTKIQKICLTILLICVCIQIAMNKLLNFDGDGDFEVIINIKCQHSFKYPG